MNTFSSSGQFFTTLVETPLGFMYAGATAKGICLCEFDEQARLDKHFQRFYKLRKIKPIEGDSPFFNELKKQLADYFNKKLVSFSLPLDLIGTPFQLKIWNELLKIPYGATRSYKQQALILNDLKSIRAVAGANAANAVSILVPCHRIIGTYGQLTGYGGKLWRKKFLLELESEQTKLFM